jgi:antitoxin (DNA-binding transcriptional repressor) of toxin-antitoxin stability system
VSENTATIRELRTNFRLVKRKIEHHGSIVITDRGEPAYVLQALPREVKVVSRMPDYYSRLVKRQPKALSPEETRKFWDQERR